MGRVHQVQGVAVEMVEVADAPGNYLLVAKGQHLGRVRFSRESGRPRWYCDCGDYDALKPPAVLAHVVSTHSLLSQRPRVLPSPAVLAEMKSYEAAMTYQRLAGKHPDPTYDAAVLGRGYSS